MKKQILLLVSALVVTITATAFGADDSWNRVKSSGKLVIGLDDVFPPMGFRNANGKLVGFDIDVAEAVGKRLGLTIEWQPTPWAEVIPALQAGKIDAIWNGMTITEERAREVAFSKPYLRDAQVALVRFDEQRFQKLDDMKGVKVGVQKGASSLGAVKKLASLAAELKEYGDNPAALRDLEDGRIDTVVIDRVAGRIFTARSSGKFKILPGIVSREMFGVAFRTEDRELREQVQKTLDAMVQDGSMAKVSLKWFGIEITDPKKW